MRPSFPIMHEMKNIDAGKEQSSLGDAHRYVDTHQKVGNVVLTIR